MAEGEHFLDHPEAKEAFDFALGVMFDESDRGAVLVGFSLIVEHLSRLVKAAAPKAMSKKDMKSLFGPTGPLGSAYGIMEVCYLSRLINKDLRDACHELRKLRNVSGAHSHEQFDLASHMQVVREIARKLSEDLPAYLNMAAAHYMYSTAVKAVQSSNPDPEILKDWPPDSHAILERILSNPELLDAMQIKAWRLELGLTVSFICALVVAQREELVGKDLGDRLLTSLSHGQPPP